MKYLYGMRLRGFSPGAQPKEGLLGLASMQMRQYHDVIAYERPLTDKEIEHYSLDFLSAEDD